MTCRAAVLFVLLAAACTSDDDSHADAAVAAGPDSSARAGSTGGDADSGGAAGQAAPADAATAPDAAPTTDAAAPDAAAPDAGPAPEVSFARAIAPVFAAKCNFCHHPLSATRVDLTRPFHPELGVIDRPTTWRGAVGQPMIDPGNPENSFLLFKITQENLDAHEVGTSMPWQVERLTAEQLDALRQWIADGANDDAFYQDTIALIFGDGTTLGRFSGKCAWCHYTGGSLPPDLMNPFDPETGAVGVTGVYGRVLIEPGDPDGSFLIEKVTSGAEPTFGSLMPYWPERVTTQEAATIERWIAEGAQDN